MLVFLAAAARTWIISSNLLRLDNSFGILVFLGNFLHFLFAQDCFPLRQTIKVVSACSNHVVEEFFRNNLDFNFRIFIKILKVVFLYDAVVDSIQETFENYRTNIIFCGKFTELACNPGRRIIQDAAVYFSFCTAVLIPEFRE